MSEICADYNNINDKLPEYRLEFINLRITMFIRLFGIKNNDWPLDCTKLISKMKESQIIPFTYGFFRLPDKYEAVTKYQSEYNLYLMQINRNRVHYPFETSADRRLNFTLAHEIGHILLDHLKVPRNLKTKEEILNQEHEANEFAGQLLLPSNLLISCNYKSINAVAEYFNVSNSALLMRLSKIYRLDLLQNKKGYVCNKCGNASMHYSAKYCCICGNKLKNNLNGIFRVSYHDGVEFNNNYGSLMFDRKM